MQFDGVSKLFSNKGKVFALFSYAFVCLSILGMWGLAYVLFYSSSCSEMMVIFCIPLYLFLPIWAVFNLLSSEFVRYGMAFEIYRPAGILLSINLLKFTTWVFLIYIVILYIGNNAMERFFGHHGSLVSVLFGSIVAFRVTSLSSAEKDLLLRVVRAFHYNNVRKFLTSFRDILSKNISRDREIYKKSCRGRKNDLDE